MLDIAQSDGSGIWIWHNIMVLTIIDLTLINKVSVTRDRFDAFFYECCLFCNRLRGEMARIVTDKNGDRDAHRGRSRICK